MAKRWQRWLVLAALSSAALAGAEPSAPVEREARLWVLTSARLLEVDPETGAVLREVAARGGERLLPRGEASPPLLADRRRIRLLAPRGGAKTIAVPELPGGADLLAAAQLEDDGGTLLVLRTAALVVMPAGNVARETSLPLVADVAAVGGGRLWAVGSSGGARLDLGDRDAAPVAFAGSWSGLPTAVCYDPLAERLVVAEAEAVHWLDDDGKEVALTPLPGVQRLACGRFGRVWAAGREGTVLLRSIGDAGGVERALPERVPSEALEIATDPRDFAVFVADAQELSRWTTSGRRVWSVELGRGEEVRNLVTALRVPMSAPATGAEATPPSARQPAFGEPKVVSAELAVRGRLALNETRPTPAPAGSGRSVASGLVTAYGAGVVTATSAPDGTFTTSAMPRTSGDSVLVYSRRQTSQGRLMAATTLAPPAGQTVDAGEQWLSWDCAMAFQNGLFPANALNGEARAMAFFDDGSGPALYVGGTFTTAGGVTVNRVAKWNGATWSALGSGLTITSGTASVDTLAVFNDGGGARLYAAGLFNRAGTATVSNVAKWTGTGWVQVGSTTPNGQVLALAVHNSQLYAGGAFTKVGTPTVNRLARWSGSAWVAVGSGLNDTVRALASHDDGSTTALYVGGVFTTAGGAAAARIAKWNGTAFSALGSGVSGGSTIQVNALSSGQLGGAAALYVGGRFTTAGSATANNVAAWQGSTWKTLGSGLAVEVSALASYDDGIGARLYAAGSFTSAGGTTFNRLGRFTGTTWEPVGSGLNGNALALGAGTVGTTPSLLAGGAFTTANGVAASRLARIVRPLSCADNTAPALVWVQPRNGAAVASSQPLLRLGAFDYGASGLDPTSLVILRNGQSIAASCTWSASGDTVDCTPPPLGGGSVTLAARIRDANGNVTPDKTISFTVADSTPPTISFVEPAESAQLTDPRPRLRLAYSDAGSGVDSSTLTITRNGSVLALECQTGVSEALCVPPAALPNGASAFAATVRDVRGNLSAAASRNVTIATPPPAKTVVRGVAVFDGGSPASGALIVIVGLPGATTTTDAGGRFSIADVAVSPATRLSLNASLTSVDVTYLGFASGILPVAGGVTDVGEVVLERRCDNFFTPLPFVAGGPDVAAEEELAGNVSQLVAFDDGSGPRLFAGGDFNWGSTGTLPRIGRWGSRGWEWGDAGLSSDGQPSAEAMVVFDDGSGPALYVGGTFTSAGGQPAKYLAKWDGSSWQEVGRGLDGPVTGLAVFDDGSGPALFVTGWFTRVGTRRAWSGADGSIAANCVAKWNGTSWSPVAGGQDYRWHDFKLAALADGVGTGLYLWERFGPGVWKLNGGSWQDIGFAAAGGAVSDLVSASIGGTPSIFAAGYSIGVKRRVGSAWVDTGLSLQESYSLAGFTDASGSFLYASPQYGAEALRRWNGSGWSGVLATGGALSVVTGLEAKPVLMRPSPLAKWQNGAWVSFPISVDTDGPVTSVAFVDGSSPAVLFAGPARIGGSVLNGSIGRWNGQTVAAAGSGLTAGGTRVVQAFDGTSRHVYGLHEPSGQIAEWNGSGWTPIGSALGIPVHDVDWIDVGDGMRLYAAGNGVYRWNGSFWHPIGGPSDSIYAIEGYQGALYAGGAFDGTGGGNLQRWNGSQWTAIGSRVDGVRGTIAALEAHNGYLHIGGDFYNAGPNDPNIQHTAIVAWDGSAWRRGEGPNCGVLRNRFVAGGESPIWGVVHALAEFDDGTGSRLLIGGDYAALCASKSASSISVTLPGYVNVNLGTGTDGPAVRALATGRWNGSPAVAVGGDFARAGGTLSGKLAIWHASPSWGACSIAGQPPKITITAPPAVTNLSAVTIAGRVDEPATLTLGGTNVPVAGDLTFSIPAMPLAEGTNTFSFEALDRSGMRGALGYSVVRDSLPPTIAFAAPAAGATVFGTAAVLDVTFSDSSSGVDTTSFALAVNGGAAPGAACTVRDGRARCTVAARQGANLATAVVRDRAGNLSAAAQLAFQASPGSVDSTRLAGSVRRADGTAASGARVRVLGRHDEAATTQADGSFSFAVTGVRSDASWTVVAELREGSTTLIGVKNGVVPIPGGTTSVATIALHEPCDGELVEGLFGSVGVAGRVRAMAVYDDGSGLAFYLGGESLRRVGEAWKHLLRWDGAHLVALPAAPDGPVRSLAVFDDGRGPALYAGGAFLHAGEVTVRNLARWDGHAWGDVGGGVAVCIGGSVNSLAVLDLGAGPRLYVGGDFDRVGAGTSADLVAAWDGHAWIGFGPAPACQWPRSSERAVFALARYDDGDGPALYAAGIFTSIGGVAATNVAERRVDGWAPLSSGLGTVTSSGAASSSVVTSLAVFPGDAGLELYAAGSFNRAGDLTSDVGSIARWNGRRWATVGDGLEVYGFAEDYGTYVRPSGVQSLAVFDDGTGVALYATGSFTGSTVGRYTSMARWNGQAWRPVGAGIGDPLTGGMAMAPFGGELYAGGGFATAGGLGVGGVARWSGGRWHPLGRGFDKPVRALAVHDDGTGPALYAGGEFTSFGDAVLRHVGRFDGETWWPLGEGTDGDVHALESFADGAGSFLYAGGHFAAAGGEAASNVARWRGDRWESLGAGLDAGATVRTLAFHDDGAGPALYAGGSISQAGGIAVGNLARWRQGAWSAAGSFDGEVRALLSASVAGSPGLFAGGSFTHVDGSPAARVARWNGVAWSALGSGQGDTVGALAPWQGGRLAAAGGSGPGSLSLWDGTEWRVPGQPNLAASALLQWDDGSGQALYVGGGFTSVAGQPAAGVAAWSDPDWSTLRGGVSGGSVMAMRGMEDGAGPALFLGGSFTVVDGVPSFALAKWMRPLSNCVDTHGAAIEVTAPAAGLVQSRPQLVASYSDTGSAVDVASLEWTLDGAPVAVTCSHQTTSSTCLADVPFADGPHQLRASVADVSGNGGTSAAVSIDVDGQSPVVSFTAPAAAAVVTDPNTAVGFTWSDAGSGILLGSFGVYFTGTSPIRLDCPYNAGGGTCTPSPPWSDGRWLARVSITDRAGNLGEAEIAFTVETQPPTAEIEAPVEGSSVNSLRPPIRLRLSDAGTGIDPVTLALTANGAPLAADCDFAATTATCVPASDLAAGTAQVTAAVRDRFGRQSAVVSRSFNVSLDATAPTITVTSPANGATTNASTIAISGRVSERSTLTIDGIAVAVQPDLTFSYPSAALNEGTNYPQIAAVDAVGNRAVATVAIRRDTQAPLLTIDAPTEGAFCDPTTMPLLFGWSDATSGVVGSSLQITVNGAPVAANCTAGTAGTSCLLAAAPSGVVTLGATVADAVGNVSPAAVVHFTSAVGGDFVAPLIEVLSPVPGAVVGEVSPQVRGRLSETAVLTRDGVAVGVQPDLTFVISGLTLSEGTSTFKLRAVDAAGNVGTLDLALTLDTQPPPSLVEALVSVAENEAASHRVAGANGAAPGGQPGMSVVVRNRAREVEWTFAVDAAGAFSGTVLGLPGDRLDLSVRDAAGNESAAISRTLAGTTPALPDPAVVAPPIDPSVPTRFCDATSFLWSGPGRLQYAAQPAAVDCERLAVVRGRVIDRTGAPLGGVAVSVLGHPDAGLTLTREDGVYDLAVNGGEAVTLAFHGDGLLPARRTEVLGWNEWVDYGTVAMVPRDAQVTTVDLLAGTMQTARGATVSDERGARRATLMFPAGTTARVLLPGGASQDLATLHVRATEYSVGSHGEESLPASMPAGLGYGYTVELSVDEADALGAERIELGGPVPLYVENFLAIPVGQEVPAGAFDRASNAWVPSTNGRVVAVLSESAGSAVLDVAGSGQPATAAELAALGISAEELVQLATLYEPGQQLWRVPLRHFTPWTIGWTYLWLQGSFGPPGRPAVAGHARLLDNPTVASFGGAIEVDNQVLHSTLDLAGTPLSLHYASDRAPGRRAAYVLEVPVTDAELPTGLERVDVEVEVAGKRTLRTFAPTPSNTYRFTWDGRDRFGRPTSGSAEWQARVTYVMPIGAAAASVGDPLGAPGALALESVTPARGRWSRTSRGRIGAVQAQQSWGLGGWSLSAQHVLDVEDETLVYGDGHRRRLANVDREPRILSLVAGTGARGSSGDGGLAKEAKLANPGGISVMHDGSLLVADRGNCRIRKIDRQGVITTVAGTICDSSRQAIGDHGDPLAALLLRPEKAIEGPAPAYDIYVADSGHHRIRRIATGWDGRRTITTFAGNGLTCPAGPLENPMDLAFDSAGNLLVVAFESVWGHGSCARGIFQVTPSGALTRLVGIEHPECAATPTSSCLGSLRQPKGLATLADGSLLYTDVNQVSRRPTALAQELTSWTIAGASRFYLEWEPTFFGDDRPAQPGSGAPSALDDGTRFNGPWGIAAGPDGTIYVADSMNLRLRTIGPDRIVHTIAGGGDALVGGGDMLATSAALGNVVGVAVEPSGKNVYFTDALSNRVYRVRLPKPRGSNELFLPSEDGAVFDVFDRQGRQLRTEDAATRRTLWSFEYGTYPAPGGGQRKLLAAATDAYGNTTTVERGVDGTPLAIVAPHGQRTQLAVDGEGYLKSVSRSSAAGAEEVRLTMDAKGLLRQLRTPRQGTYVYDYDAEGRLRQVNDPEQGQLQLTYEELAGGSHRVKLVTAEGRSSTTEVRLPPSEVHQDVTSPASLLSTSTWRQASSWKATSSGMPDFGALLEADERLGWGGVKRLSDAALGSESAPLQVLQASRTFVNAAAAGEDGPPPALLHQTDMVSVNGVATTTSYDAASKTVTATSPTGRSLVTVLDGFGRVAEVRSPGLLPVVTSYDGSGRVAQVTQGERSTSFGYHPSSGYLETVTDALGRQTRYERDGVGRVTKTTLPDEREVGFRYDLDGNVVEVTPPSRPAHRFDSNLVSQVKDAIAPEVGVEYPVTHYSYNRDHQVTGITRPSGEQVTMGYDAAGRPASVTASSGATTYGYDPASGRLSSVTTSDGTSIGYTYDGPWLSQLTVSGAAAGSVHFGPDHPSGDSTTHFRLASLRIEGAEAVTMDYDADGLPTRIGALDLARDPASGRLQGSHLLQSGERLSRDAFGELLRLEAGFGAGPVGTPLLDVTYERDQGGRILHKTETTRAAVASPPTTSVYAYSYEAGSGRLTQVKRDGSIVETYAYDANGNRTSWTTGSGSGTATYDAQDRLLHYGALDFTYTANGELRSKSQGGQTATCAYDPFGNLRAVRLPDGTQVEYLVDGEGHRIGKKVAGTIVQRWLYAGGLAPIAEVSSSGAVTTQYFYGTRGNVPDYFVRGGVAYRLIADHLGSVRYVIDATTGTVAQRMEYDSFGRVTLDTSPGFQPFGFAGGQYDYQTGLVRFGARDYDAETGRWTSKDPIGFAGGDTNLYGYSLSDPVNLTDPAGTETSVCATVGDGDCEPSDEEAIGIANFAAGAGDSLTMGLTGVVRAATTGDGIVNRCSGEYRAGEWGEVAAEAVLTLGSAMLKKTAARASRTAVRNEARRLTRNIVRDGNELDHINPLFGHPLALGGGPTLFPTGGLPAAIHSGPWNLRLLGPPAHLAAHARLMLLETVGKVVVNPLTSALRVVRNGTNDSQCRE